MATKKELSKADKIKNEKKKLEKIFKPILDEKKMKLAQSLIDKVSFMCVTLESLQEEITEKGCIEEYQNGKSQWGLKKSTAVDIYNTMIKNYNTVMKQLLDLLPKEVKVDDIDEFDEFINKK